MERPTGSQDIFSPPQEKVLVGVLLAGEPQAQSQHCHQVAAKMVNPRGA